MSDGTFGFEGPDPFTAAMRRNGELAARLARAEELLVSVRGQCETFLQERIALERKLEAIAKVLAT